MVLQGQTGHSTKALARSGPLGLQSLMRIDLIGRDCRYTGMKYVRIVSEGSLYFIQLQLNKTQAMTIRSASVIGRPFASYFVFGGIF